MNIAEKLSRETARVAALKARLDDRKGKGRLELAPLVAMLEQALEHAHEAAGTDDAITTIAALKELERWQE